MVNVLVIGNGARESALGRAFLQSEAVTTVYVAPGNAGMSLIGLEPVAISASDFPALIDFARKNVSLTFVGPEVPLAGGIVDAFQAAALPVFGPTKQLAQLESSKTFAKQFMHAHNLPTARSEHVDNLADANAALADFGVPVVIKADGLAAGKGVTVAKDDDAAAAAIADLYANHANAPVLIEEFLSGQEASVLAMFNGEKRVIFPLAQDHKRRFDADKGPNTGGMGAISPAPQFTPDEIAQAQSLVDQTLAGMTEAGLVGNGVLYIGLIFTADGLKILEYNLRFGDPETQVLMPQVTSDFYQLTVDLLAGKQPTLHLDGQSYCGVVAASPQYPHAEPATLPVITPNRQQRNYWYPANVTSNGDSLQTTGGRVFTVVGSGTDIAAACAQAYTRLQPLAGALTCRQDIGWHAITPN